MYQYPEELVEVSHTLYLNQRAKIKNIPLSPLKTSLVSWEAVVFCFILSIKVLFYKIFSLKFRFGLY